MIPVKLTLEGLYSYRDAQVINFSPLTNAGLFGIFGGVGSGKSSILEAISFALYGETERLNSRENRSYNMMNLKSNKLWIDFEFKGNDGVIYRFTVSGRRNGKNYDDVKTLERNAYKLVNENWEPISVNDAETITGLNYTNFKRTIIIPQGRFQEFLQLTEKDRVSMLKELFNLQKYDLSFKVSALEKKNLEALNTIQGQLLEVGEIDPGIIEIKEKELRELSNLLKLKKDELKLKDQQDQHLQNLLTLTNSIKTEKERLQKLLASEKEMEALQAEIKQFEVLSLTFKADFDQFDRLGVQLKAQEKEITTSKEAETKLKAETEIQTKNLTNLKPAYDSNALLATEAEELNKLADKKTADSQVEEIKGRTTKGQQVLKEMDEALIVGKNLVDQLTADIAKHKKALPDIQMLNVVKAWFVETDRLAKSYSDVQARKTKASDDIQKIQLQAFDLFKKSGFVAKDADNPSFAEMEAAIREKKQLVANEKTKLDAEIAKLMVQQKLEQYAHALVDGSPCPLCGSEHHPQKLNAGEVKLYLQELGVQNQDLVNSEKAIDQLEKELIRLQAERVSADRQLKAEELILQQEATKQKLHTESFAWSEFDAAQPELLHKAFEVYEKTDRAIKACELELQKANTAYAKQQENKEKADRTMRELETQLITLTTQVDLLLSQIKQIDIKLFDNETPVQLRQLASEKLQLQKEIIKQFETYSLALQKMQQELSALSGKLTEAQKNRDALEQEQNAVKNTIANKLKLHADLTEEFIRSVLQKDLAIDKEKERIALFYTSLSELKGLISGLKKQLDDKKYDAEEHERLKNEIGGLKQFVDKETGTVSVLEVEIKRIKATLEQFGKLTTERDKLVLRGQDITELKRLFKGNGFVNFVSTAHLENLCRAANERLLKLTRQKLGIEITSDNNFIVRDYMNEGKLRSVKTLSGGQTFQASLSLALSLADSIHRMSGSSENFFFLDEGFGSLDKDTLAIIFESLKALRKENRIVGFISHVEEMQQQIDTYIRVENQESIGSKVFRSWEE